MLIEIGWVGCVFSFVFKVQCEVTVEEASWEEIDVCGGLLESESMGVNGLSCAICNSTGEEEPSQGRLPCYFYS